MRNQPIRQFAALCLGLVVAAAVPRVAAAQITTMTLAWDPSPDPSATGYVLSLGLASGSYTTAFDVQNVTTAQVANLDPTTTYYFVVQAYDVAGDLSVPSNEVSGVPDPTIVAPVDVAAPSNPQPADGAVNVRTNMDLGWSGCDGCTYWVAFGTSPVPGVVSPAMVDAQYALPRLARHTTYYWSVTAVGASGATASSPGWSFTTR